MSTFLLVASYALGALVVVDGARRPEDAWAGAGRSKGSGLTWMILLSLFGLGALVAAWYGLFLLPRLGHAGVQASAPLRRGPGNRRQAP